MLPAKREQYLRRFFEISLLFKAIFAVGEIVAGIGSYVVTSSFLSQLVGVITNAELAEDPRDLVANYLVNWAQHLSLNAQRFIGFYLLVHGAVKLWLIFGLLRERLWYYPAALAVFGLFVIYQIYRFSFTYSFWLVLITIVDIMVIGLTWHEYKFLRRLKTPAL